MEKIKASQLMRSGCNCAQSVLVSLRQTARLDEKTAMKLACPLGGGCRSGEICGALSGALLAIGMVNGNTDPSDKEAQQAAYKQYIEFCKMFSDKFGAKTCRQLLGVDTSTANGHQFFAEHPEVKETICFKVIDETVAMTEEFINKLRP